MKGKKKKRVGNEGRVNTIRKEGKAPWLGDAAKRRKKKIKKTKKPNKMTWVRLIGHTSQLTILIWLVPHVFPAVFT